MWRWVSTKPMWIGTSSTTTTTTTQEVVNNLNVISLEQEMPDWRVSGKCAMISFHDNKTCP
jgi:hypothetical protein